MGLTQGAFKNRNTQAHPERFWFNCLWWGPDVLLVFSCFWCGDHWLKPSSKDRTGGKQLREIQITISWGWGERNKMVSLPTLWKCLLWITWKLPAVIQPLRFTATGGKLTHPVNQMNWGSGYIVSSLVQWNINPFLFIVDSGRFLGKMRSSCSLDRKGVSPSWFPEGAGGAAGHELVYVCLRHWGSEATCGKCLTRSTFSGLFNVFLWTSEFKWCFWKFPGGQLCP